VSKRQTAKDFAQGMAALLAPLGPLRVRALFGGYGLYLEERIFAITGWGRLWFKVDAETRQRFLAAGGKAFVYPGSRGPVEMSYCTPPPEALESFERLVPWAELALQAAARAAAAKNPSRSRCASPHPRS